MTRRYQPITSCSDRAVRALPWTYSAVRKTLPLKGPYFIFSVQPKACVDGVMENRITETAGYAMLILRNGFRHGASISTDVQRRG